MSISVLAARLGAWPRRALALCCLLIAVATAVGAHHARASHSGRPVVVAARDLAAGTRLGAADLRVMSWPDKLRPPNALAGTGSAVGRRLGGAIRANEAITSTRLAGGDLTAGLPPGRLAVPVTISAAAGQGLVHPGDSIDLLVSAPPDAELARSASARIVAEAVRVLAVAPGPSADVSPPVSASGAITIIVAADRPTIVKIVAVSGRVLVAAARNPP